jgi:hypothetical protein
MVERSVTDITRRRLELATISGPICTKNRVKNTAPRVSVLFQTQSLSEKSHKVKDDEAGAAGKQRKQWPFKWPFFSESRENRRHSIDRELIKTVKTRGMNKSR